MSSVFARSGHQTCLSTRLRLPQVNVISKRHIQLKIVPVTPTQSPKSPAPFRERTPRVPAVPPKPPQDFNSLIEFVQGGIGSSSKRAVPSRGIRSASWSQMFLLVRTAEELEQVAEMFPKWREMQRSFRATDSELFVRRCEELGCPLLALRVFSNRPKYAFTLSSHLAAVQLIHSLHLAHPLDETISASSLFEVNKLAPATSSLPACAMLISACFYNQNHPTHPKDPRARELADTLLPILQELCAVTPASMIVNPFHRKNAVFFAKSRAWTVGALKRIKWVLKKEGKWDKYRWIGAALEKFGKSDVEPAALDAPVMLLAAPARQRRATEKG
ncbi:hypothetical protein PILCRDRAFT_815384 [Piloderma croceum F 1598]|uniref:Uncharacterized protein n=1 Tax=Piloderma croceum (strain F 1598) TaxID=765440 RepID=A0A0C3FS66_PILCF|nr:hypothetical protein PILCRDRAFT_815384 [Piloderma croceum F 1598]